LQTHAAKSTDPVEKNNKFLKHEKKYNK
jgi:hypothetical protein